jgi:xylan 1,4-beta-xylosidase
MSNAGESETRGFPIERTYVNPLALPEYPRGRESIKKEGGGWMHGTRRDFRETADPSVLYHGGKWHLYPSCGMAWVSEDFVTFKHHRIEPYDAGYAPTIAEHRGKIYLCAGCSALYCGAGPLGPFESMGKFMTPSGETLYAADPMIFPDEDGSVYLYWGCGEPGIFGARLDPAKPTQLATKPELLFGYDPSHEWERTGDLNEDASHSWIEGPWMFKHGKTYHLTYAAPGTEWKTYGMGCYVSDKPLGPFKYAKRNPILRDTEGLVHGPGHGCIVRGPKDTLWAFYTHLVRNQHNFERRVGMDPAGIDAEGNLFVLGASETPQWAPGLLSHPERGNDAGLTPMSINKHVKTSSEVHGREGAYAVDNVMRTWWEPAATDRRPWIEVDWKTPFHASAARILWAEPGLDYDGGVRPGPVKYKIELSDEAKGEGWRMAVDRTENEEDMLIEYRTFAETVARRARLTITGRPEGMNTGVIEVTVFGRQGPPARP